MRFPVELKQPFHKYSTRSTYYEAPHYTNFFSLMLLPVLRSNYIHCSMVFVVISTHHLSFYLVIASTDILLQGRSHCRCFISRKLFSLRRKSLSLGVEPQILESEGCTDSIHRAFNSFQLSL
jgi:hypothetical protein